jgi:hypothetical protein
MRQFPISLVAIISLGFAAGCSLKAETANAGQGNSSVPTNTNSVRSDEPALSKSSQPTPAKSVAYPCDEQKQAGKRYIKSQSFTFDYKPFERSCFVTFGSTDQMTDEKDYPRGSTFYIYKDGKQVFEFPSAFGGIPGCWVEGGRV